jgi:hypothetical protein
MSTGKLHERISAPHEQAQQVAGVVGWAGGFGVHAGGCILQAASSGRLVCGSSNDRRGYFIGDRSIPTQRLRAALQAGHLGHVTVSTTTRKDISVGGAEQILFPTMEGFV